MKKLAWLMQKKRTVIALAILVALAAGIACFCWYVQTFSHGENAPQPTGEQRSVLADYLDKTYPAKRRQLLRPLPYGTTPAALDIAAKSAILIDTANGCILYEKNADLFISN